MLDLDDLLSERYRQFLVNGCKQTVFGTFSNRIPKSLLMAEPFLRRLVLERERRMMARRELSTPHRFDVTFLTSETEASQLRGDGANVRVYANPQATVASTYDWRMNGQAEKLVQCFFIGNLRTSQNLASLKLIIREIMPLVLERGLDIHVHVVGDYDARAIEAASGCSRVTMHGFISDLSEVVQRCSIALLPIVEGTGVKTKILDAMAMGIPVITNGLGVEGLSVVHERDLLIADTARETADQIARLNLDDGLGKRLSEQAKSYVARNHDPTLLRERFREHIFTALEVGRARLMYSSPDTVS
ncbi:glycosyltransferase family 4 protein [Paraburkholderia aspalathi]|uniref:glycosyltransferase family 4 protein n=1 Tax=Paraburkholderia aspalathi TaxID=1324617 RepID=UPI0038B77757